MITLLHDNPTSQSNRNANAVLSVPALLLNYYAKSSMYFHPLYRAKTHYRLAELPKHFEGYVCVCLYV